MDARELLPSYRSHKTVRAARIRAIEFKEDGAAVIAWGDGPVIVTGPKYRDRVPGLTVGDPRDLGYYVLYADGYESWSPAKAFEEGYTAIVPEGATVAEGR